jgi:mannose-1-phosphate guanylyltransferase/mannose-6-phosphate isomerase
MSSVVMPSLIPVILAGGSGTRLWPVSRETFPKQLVRLAGEDSLLQQTARRLLASAPPERIVTVGAKSQDFLVQRQLSDVAPDLGRHRLLEPAPRNTAAAIALATLYARARMDADALLWVCPSDHLMQRPKRLLEALEQAMPAALAGEIVTFGIEPTRAETGYGYIEAGEPWPGAKGVLQTRRFVEKPGRAAAEAMLAVGGHFWNGGIFLFRGERLIEELRAHRPDILEAVERAFAALRDGGLPGSFELPPELYEAVPAAPIDTAVMERAARIVVVPCDPGWSDVGSWQALWEQLPKDAADNAISGDAWLDEAERCLVHAGRRLVVCSGVQDLAVVETDDAVLVADLARGDAIRTLVTALKDAGRPEAMAHGEEHRPWGSFRVLHEGPGFKVKEIVVAPGGRLSLQSHRHRAEHWVVVAGTARVTVDDGILLLEPNQSVHIPLGARHRMENPGEVAMHLIEVQCGGYLGEDDIIRYEDVYGRS